MVQTAKAFGDKNKIHILETKMNNLCFVQNNDQVEETFAGSIDNKI